VAVNVRQVLRTETLFVAVAIEVGQVLKANRTFD
jgi:hypothetical protein